MKTVVRNILAVIVGILLGGLVNMSLIAISGSIIPPPNGADVSTIEGLQSSIHLFEPKHFIFPFLAHSLGTFTSALVAALIAVNYKMIFAIGLGIFGLLGGIAAVLMIPAPLWYNILDLVGAYLPFAYLAGKLATKH